MQKRDPPVAVCTNCGDFTHSVDRINQSCSRRLGHYRCKGIYSSRISIGDWRECESCEAQGCERCNHVGYFLVRLR